ncbi:NAD-dependent DNA ligase LigA, partial [Buchnera aphidicola]|nr:NAD-dependent DNA ligase LigA [Buchnera aphidicola]
NKSDISNKSLQKNFFYQKKIVLTGVFSMYSRHDLKKILMDLGAQLLTFVSKKIDLLIYGKNFGSKFYKARFFKIEMINEEQLKNLLKIYV